jgi:BirA family biotin operon repressor/biotin-[acetyl-CoA-carboxylase] ligase
VDPKTHGHRERSLDLWPEAIEAVCRETTLFTRVRVLRETTSTQDAAAGLAPGTIVTAGRQVAGRGRLGAAWADTGEEGLAVTFILPSLDAERLGMAAAVASAEAIREGLPADAAARTGIKWPNDIVIVRPDGGFGKLCGVLVERSDRGALVGIGVNVRQSAFPSAIADRAVSLAMLGASVDRLEVLLRLVRRMDRWVGASEASLSAGYRELDRTVGLRLRFQTPSGPVEGVVQACEPRRGLVVRTQQGEVHLPAATTRVDPEPPEGRSTMHASCSAPPAS